MGLMFFIPIILVFIGLIVWGLSMMLIALWKHVVFGYGALCAAVTFIGIFSVILAIVGLFIVSK